VLLGRDFQVIQVEGFGSDKQEYKAVNICQSEVRTIHKSFTLKQSCIFPRHIHIINIKFEKNLTIFLRVIARNQSFKNKKGITHVILDVRS